MSNIKTISNSGTESTNNWSTTIGEYLLRRRRQTQLAYRDQLTMSSAEEDINSSNSQDWLFGALFEILVQQLEAGHTVFVLDSSGQSARECTMHDSSYTGLFAWQQQLLTPLVRPLLAEVTSFIMTDISATELLENDETWQLAMRQSTLLEYDQQVLEQRYNNCVQLYRLLKDITSRATSIINSLSNFIQLLNKQPFLTNQKLINDCSSENKADSPIVFQTDNDAEHTSITITLWLHRTWQAEYALAQHIMRIKNHTLTTLPVTLNPLLNVEQQDAIHMANRSAFSIITGGPGTGKTFTVAQLVIALQQEQIAGSVTDINLALAAPTGKAAQRMQESIQDAIQQAGISIQLPEAKTIHRLLGIGQGGRPRYHTDNPLSEDIIIVDEASMLGVELANHLVGAIKPKARLILLGDANQLAAVDAGAVLADLCRLPALQDIHQQLVASRRFTDDSGIGKLAKLINQASTNKQNMSDIWQLLQEDESLAFYHLRSDASERMNSDDIRLKKINSLSKNSYYKELSNNYEKYFKQTQKVLSKMKRAESIPVQDYLNNFAGLIDQLNQFRVLTAGHHGHCGDHQINHYLSEQHKTQLKWPLSKSAWYHGRPVMVLQNNYELGLFNGDIGICLQTENGRLQVFFENKKQGIHINMLSDEIIATAYAMTIHKSQGSEFDHVAISFDDNHTRLLSQELIYTAVTRAKKQVSMFGTSSALTLALSTPTVRQTGLGLQFNRLTD